MTAGNKQPPPNQESAPDRVRSPGAGAPPRGRNFGRDVLGVLFMSLGTLLLLGMFWPTATSGVLASLDDFLKQWFGWGRIWVVVFLFLAGGLILRRGKSSQRARIPWGRLIALELAALTSLALLSVLGGMDVTRAEQGLDGGQVGWGLTAMFSFFGLGIPVLLGLLLLSLLVLCLVFASGLDARLFSWAKQKVTTQTPAPVLVESGEMTISEAPLRQPEGSRASSTTAGKKRISLPIQFRKNFRLSQEAEPVEAAELTRDERLPPLTLLTPEQSARLDERTINLTAGLIEKTLADFGIPATVIDFQVGPTVTQFAVEPGFLEKEKSNNEGDLASRQKVRVAQIASLRNDLALALSAERLRIEAPVPGRPYIGIEVPNVRSIIVRLRPILESETFRQVDSPLAIVLGRDVSGQAVVADLSKMPHLLISGTTGSGKSVCIAAITACLAMSNTPEDLRLVMVDPKMVELVRFNGLPHLMGKVETELNRILGVLRWVVLEMDHRYKLLETARTRNIDTYNRKVRKKKGEQPLPRIILIIDELADLMMSSPDQTEHSLVRLAQMARATGIHLVVATQRPSTDVVTGLIKANFPARISFAVASSIDSRVILDTHGAETLLGRGDMLYMAPDASSPVRAQGVLVTDQEVEKIISYWQKALPVAEVAPLSPWEELLKQEEILADKDNLIEQAIVIVRETRRANASLLQRRLRIGYPRAARLMEELEAVGVVGPPVGGGREREVLIEQEDKSGSELK